MLKIGSLEGRETGLEAVIEAGYGDDSGLTGSGERGSSHPLCVISTWLAWTSS